MVDALRVLLLSWRDSRHPEGGGAEVFLERIASGLRSRGHEVTIRCAAYRGALREEVVDGVRFVRRGGRFSVYPRAAFGLLRRRRGYDVVVDVQNGVPFWAPLFTRAKIVNLTHHVHREQWGVIFGPLAARFGWWLESRLAPRVYRRCRYVTVSRATRDDLVGLGVRAASIGVVYNGHDVVADDDLVPLPRSAHPTLVVLGRLVPHKRVPTKHRLLAGAWLHVLPSVKEGWGLAVIEAAAHRIPTVAFRSAGGPVESVLDGETGLLVDDAEGMTEALRLLLTDGDLRRELGDRARRYADGFTWAGTVTAFEAELCLAAGRPPSRPAPARQPVPAGSALVVADQGLVHRRDARGGLLGLDQRDRAADGEPCAEQGRDQDGDDHRTPVPPVPASLKGHLLHAP